MPAGEQGFQIVIDPNEWYRLKKDLDAFDPALARALRARIKNAGQVAADEVKKTLALPSPGGGDDSGEGRAALIAATRLTVSFGKSAAGAKIVTGSSRLSAEHKGLVNVYNKKTFRHPVHAARGSEAYSDPNRWVPQQGRPYFRSSIYKALDRVMVREVRAALDEAVNAIGGRGK